MACSDVPHTIGKLWTRATTILWTSSQSKVCTQSFAPTESRESQLWEFWDSPDKMTFGCWSVPGTKYTIKGKVMASPKSGSWWILWICVCSWFVRASKCCNYALTNLLFGLCGSVWINEVFVNLPSPILELQHTLLPLKWCEPGSTPNSSFRCLHFWTRSWVHQRTWGCIIWTENSWTIHLTTIFLWIMIQSID